MSAGGGFHHGGVAPQQQRAGSLRSSHAWTHSASELRSSISAGRSSAGSIVGRSEEAQHQSQLPATAAHWDTVQDAGELPSSAGAIASRGSTGSRPSLPGTLRQAPSSRPRDDEESLREVSSGRHSEEHSISEVRGRVDLGEGAGKTRREDDGKRSPGEEISQNPVALTVARMAAHGAQDVDSTGGSRATRGSHVVGPRSAGGAEDWVAAAADIEAELLQAQLIASTTATSQTSGQNTSGSQSSPNVFISKAACNHSAWRPSLGQNGQAFEGAKGAEDAPEIWGGPHSDSDEVKELRAKVDVLEQIVMRRLQGEPSSPVRLEIASTRNDGSPPQRGREGQMASRVVSVPTSTRQQPPAVSPTLCASTGSAAAHVRWVAAPSQPPSYLDSSLPSSWTPASPMQLVLTGRAASRSYSPLGVPSPRQPLLHHGVAASLAPSFVATSCAGNVATWLPDKKKAPEAEVLSRSRTRQPESSTPQLGRAGVEISRISPATACGRTPPEYEQEPLARRRMLSPAPPVSHQAQAPSQQHRAAAASGVAAAASNCGSFWQTSRHKQAVASPGPALRDQPVGMVQFNGHPRSVSPAWRGDFLQPQANQGSARSPQTVLVAARGVQRSSSTGALQGSQRRSCSSASTLKAPCFTFQPFGLTPPMGLVVPLQTPFRAPRYEGGERYANASQVIDWGSVTSQTQPQPPRVCRGLEGGGSKYPQSSVWGATYSVSND